MKQHYGSWQPTVNSAISSNKHWEIVLCADCKMKLFNAAYSQRKTWLTPRPHWSFKRWKRPIKMRSRSRERNPPSTSSTLRRLIGCHAITVVGRTTSLKIATSERPFAIFVEKRPYLHGVPIATMRRSSPGSTETTIAQHKVGIQWERRGRCRPYRRISPFQGGWKIVGPDDDRGARERKAAQDGDQYGSRTVDHFRGDLEKKFPDEPLNDSSIILKTYTSERIRVIRQLNLSVVCEGQKQNLVLLVVEGNCPSLYGRNWTKYIHPNWHKIGAVHSSSHLQSIVEKHEAVFKNELGRIRSYTATLRATRCHTQVFQSQTSPLCNSRCCRQWARPIGKRRHSHESHS